MTRAAAFGFGSFGYGVLVLNDILFGEFGGMMVSMALFGVTRGIGTDGTGGDRTVIEADGIFGEFGEMLGSMALFGATWGASRDCIGGGMAGI